MAEKHSPPTSLVEFQSELSAYLRGNRQAPTMQTTSAPALSIYKNLVFNNVTRFIDKCFPVAKSMIPEHQWQDLRESFFARYSCPTPLFNDIPKHFCNFIRQQPTDLQHPWLADLLHYEWLELAADTHPGEVPAATPYSPECLLAINPTLFNASYSWPVHRLSPKQRDLSSQAVHLLVYRDVSDQVKFIEINALTAELIDLLSRNPSITTIKLLNRLHQTQPQFERDLLHQFGAELIKDLVAQNAVIAQA